MERVLTPDNDSAEFQAWQGKVRGTNISPTSLLATDYLNHFNEIIMLLGMVPSMPELVEVCRGWRPKGYVDHFRASGLSDRELAIAAYDHVPARFKVPFEDVIAQMNRVAESALEQLTNAQDAGDAQLLAVKADTASRLLQHLHDCASAVIHGTNAGMSQADIDAFLQA